MPPPPPPERRPLVYVLLALATLALAAILVPFYGTLLWAVIVALLFTPLYRLLLPRLGRRRSAAAGVTVLAVLLIGVLPFVFISAALLGEAAYVAARFQQPGNDPTTYLRTIYEALPDWIAALLARLDIADFGALQRRIGELLNQGSQFFATHALRIGQNTFEFFVSVLVMLYVAFFLIRDGDALKRALHEAIPLTDRHQRQLTAKFTDVVRATVKGNLVVATVQGSLGGLAFWILGIRGALLWAVLMGFLSLLPAVGAAIVWLPVALWLLASGATVEGFGLIAWGLLVIGLVDNLLRPRLVGKDTKLPDWVVLITTLGGLAVFGINGFVLGPLIAAMFFSVWQIAIVQRRSATPAASETPPPPA